MSTNGSTATDFSFTTSAGAGALAGAGAAGTAGLDAGNLSATKYPVPSIKREPKIHGKNECDDEDIDRVDEAPVDDVDSAEG
jgi:hypothetical protein